MLDNRTPTGYAHTNTPLTQAPPAILLIFYITTSLQQPIFYCGLCSTKHKARKEKEKNGNNYTPAGIRYGSFF